MATVTIMPAGKSIEVTEGTTLADAIFSADTNFPHDCEEKGCSGTCHVFVQEGRKGLSKIAREENEKLDAIVGVGSKSRLACQAKVLGTENIKVELLGFGSGV
jgi:ferredoxin, 2Fe-2S